MNCRAKDRHHSVVTRHRDLRRQRAGARRSAKVVIDEDRERIEVVVPDTNNQLSLAIGRRGQNVRLASQLTGWISIFSRAGRIRAASGRFREFHAGVHGNR